MTGAYTCPSMKYNWMRGSDVAKSKLPGSIALSLSCSVFTKKAFFRWKVINGTNLRTSAAIPAQPSTIMYVIKNVAFMGIVLPTVFVNLQNNIHVRCCQSRCPNKRYLKNLLCRGLIKKLLKLLKCCSCYYTPKEYVDENKQVIFGS